MRCFSVLIIAVMTVPDRPVANQTTFPFLGRLMKRLFLSVSGIRQIPSKMLMYVMTLSHQLFANLA
jgi:hypothetical protein